MKTYQMPNYILLHFCGKAFYFFLSLLKYRCVHLSSFLGECPISAGRVSKGRTKFFGGYLCEASDKCRPDVVQARCQMCVGHVDTPKLRSVGAS